MTPYNIDVVKVKVIKDYNLALTFEDGKAGQVDIAQLIPFEGVWEVLKDRHYFNTVHVDPEIGTICWEEGVDLSPSLLYESIIENNLLNT